MTKQELQQMIAEEVQKQVKSIVPKLVKPLVQEAVAGALANLLAEGIVNPPTPRPSRPTQPGTRPAASGTPPARPIQPAVLKSGLPDSARRSMASKLGYGSIDRIGESTETNFSGVSGILAETAASMGDASMYDTPSVLDAIDQVDSMATPDVVEAITRDYSELMSRMKQKGKLRG
jgi:hypothetical protein